MDKTFQFMGKQIEAALLPTHEEILEALSIDDSEQALDRVQEDRPDGYGCNLNWRYPISDGNYAGAIIIPVREGFLWLPYENMDKGELSYALADIELLDAESVTILEIEAVTYMQGLIDALEDMKHVVSMEEGDVN